MKKIIIDSDDFSIIPLSGIRDNTPIFAKKKGEDNLCGMLVLDISEGGWILRIGGSGGATGYHSSRKKCLESCLALNYEFYIS